MSFSKSSGAEAPQERPLSAFAARKVLRKQNAQSISQKETLIDTSTSDIVPSPVFRKDAARSFQKISRKRKRATPSTSTDDPIKRSLPNVSRTHAEAVVTKNPVKSPSKRNLSSQVFEDRLPSRSFLLGDNDLDTQSSRLGSELEYDFDGSVDSDNSSLSQPERTSNQQLSNYEPSDSNVLSSSKKEWTIRLIDGDMLAPIGQYELWVRKGAVTISGALLYASAKLYQVYAPSTHALPVIRHLRSPFGPAYQPAEITLYSFSTNIRLLRRLSLKFMRIWNREGEELHRVLASKTKPRRSFTLLKHSSEDFHKRPVTPLVVYPGWQTMVLKLLEGNGDARSTRPKVIMVCGPKGSGKSTVTRLLMNAFIARTQASSDVALLDLDSGQPEYSPPGNISLLRLKSYNLGPPYTHPLVPDGAEDLLIRAHHINGNSPRDDPIHYIQCATDLYNRYQEMLSVNSSCPLVINCCGWITGSGLEILEELVQIFRPTDIVYMSTKGPEDVTEVLQIAAGQTRSLFHTLPSQSSEVTSRSSADLRTMQTLSYFHSDEAENGVLRWNASPIHTIKPINLHWAGTEQSFFGIMILGDELPIELLAELIDGSVLGVVAVENDSALPEDALAVYDSERDLSTRPEVPNTNAMDLAFEVDLPAASTNGISGQTPESPNSASPSLKLKPSLRRSKVGLPYLFTGSGTCIPLCPSKTHCIGQIFIRSIHNRTQTLQVITPIPHSTFAHHLQTGTKLILVRGKLDQPNWAYEEECRAGLSINKERARWRRYRDEGLVQDSTDELSPVDFDVEMWAERAPWVTLERTERHRRDRVWRVRRNLETGNGGK